MTLKDLQLGCFRLYWKGTFDNMPCDKLLLQLLNQCKFAVFHEENLQIHHFFGYIFEAHLHKFGASDLLKHHFCFMSYIGSSLFRKYKTIGLPVKSNWCSYRTFFSQLRLSNLHSVTFH